MRYAKLKGTLAALALVGLGSGAMAATVDSINTGQANDGIFPLFGVNAVEGWYGASLYAIGDLTLKAEYWGSEASYNNRFAINDAVVASTGGNTSPAGTFGFQSVVEGINVSSGLINFWFGADQDSASVSNGDGVVSGGPNFFLSFGANPDLVVDGNTASSGQYVWLFFDDAGANPEDNHDDMVVRLAVSGGSIGISPVPVPAGGLLLLGGLAGLAALKRRRRAA